MEAYSLSWLQREREELRRDRAAYATSLDILTRRVLESNETDIPRRPLLHEWSGTRACIGSLEMALHAVERTLNEVTNLISAIENGEAPNLDAPSPTTQGSN